MANILQKLAFASIAFSIAALDINPAQAANLNFMVTPDSGPLAGETYSGSFSYNDADVTGSGEEFIAVTDLDFNFLGVDYTETDGTAPEVLFDNGNFMGLLFSTDTFSFIVDVDYFEPSESEAYFAYEIAAVSGAADITYKDPTTVPEPSALLGLSLLSGGMLLVGKKVQSAKRR